MNKIYQICFLLIGCSVASFGGNSLETSSGAVGSVAVTPVQGDMHWDLRVHGVTAPSGTQTIASFEGFAIATDGENVYLQDNVDTFSGTNYYAEVPIPSGSTDFMVRAQRCTESGATCTWVGGPYLEIEVWNIDGTNYNSAISPITSLNSVSSGTVLVGNSNGLSADLAYVRWCSGTTQMNTYVDPVAPPYPNGNAAPVSCNAIGDWELDGNGNDSGANAYNLNFSGTPSYSTTPTPAPGCVLPMTSFSLAFTATLSSRTCGSLQDNPALTYAWTILNQSSPGADGVTQSGATLSSSTAASPTVTGLVRGSLNVQLQICDAASQCTITTVHDGEVATDSNHNVPTTGISTIDEFYMPMVQWGYNPYPYFDNQAKVLADYFGSGQTSTYDPTIAQPGSVTCTHGSGICTFSDANPAEIFCGSSTGTTGLQNILFVPWYNSGYARDAYQVASCTPTTITFNGASYQGPTSTGSGMQWSVAPAMYPIWNLNGSLSSAKITCTNGSSSCTVSGVNPETVFCGGGISSDGATTLIVWNTDGGGSYRTPYNISACSTSGVTLSQNYNGTTAGANGVSFSTWGADNQAAWSNQSNNVNYYDNAMAFFALYFRSGVDTYYRYGVYMAQTWFAQPFVNQGYSCSLGGQYTCLVSNSARDATTGMTTAYLLGQLPNYLTGAEIFWEATDEYLLNPPADGGNFTTPIFDLRVMSMHLSRTAQWAILESGTNQTNAVNALQNTIPVWASWQGTGSGVTGTGYLTSPSYGTGPFGWNGGSGAVFQVTNGSTAVSGSGTNWTSGTFSQEYFITSASTSSMTCNPAIDSADSVAYFSPTVNSDTSLTLAIPYEGSTSSNPRGWQANNVVGCGQEPFFVGFFLHAAYYAYLAPVNTATKDLIKQVLLNAATWFENYGFAGTAQSPAPTGLTINGIFYARGYVESEPNPWADFNNWCQAPALGCSNATGDLLNLRNIAAETMAGIAYAHLLGDTSQIPFTLYSALYGGLGGSGADQYYIADFFGSPAGPADYQYWKMKDFGFGMGWGNGAVLPALMVPERPGRGTVSSGVVSSGVIR